MARKSIVDNKFQIVDKLKKIQNGEAVSRYLTDKLVDLGYVNMIEHRAPGQRGQTSKKFEISGKGKGYIGLSKSWKRA